MTSGAGSFSYNTTEKKVPVGEQSLTIRYYTAEDSETEAASTAVSLTLSPKQLTASGLTAVDKVFDGTTAIEVKVPEPCPVLNPATMLHSPILPVP